MLVTITPVHTAYGGKTFFAMGEEWGAYLDFSQEAAFLITTQALTQQLTGK